METDFRKIEVPVLSSMHQDQQKGYALLGMDTEMLFKTGKQVIWPHTVGFPQERELKNPNCTLQGRTTAQIIDFHGDGYAMELCVPAVHCLEYMMEHVGKAFRWVSQNRKLSPTGDITVSAPAIYKVPKDVVESAPDEVKRLGCMPSFNIYDDPGNPTLLPDGLRTTGCHLHMSHPTLADREVAFNLVRWADILVGTTWAYVSPENSSKEALRRKAYGRAGEFRLKEYGDSPVPGYESYKVGMYSHGVEYRVLPGTVIKHPAYMTLMFNLYRTALVMANNNITPPEDLTDGARQAINNADRVAAKSVLKELNFQRDSLNFFASLQNDPLKISKPYKWYEISQNHNGMGHQRVYRNRCDTGKLPTF